MDRSSTKQAVTHTFHISGLTCADCAAKLAAQIRSAKEVEEATLNFLSATLTVRSTLSREAIARLVEQAGYSVVSENVARPSARTIFIRTHFRALTTLISGCFLLLAWGLSVGHDPSRLHIALFLTAILVGGFWTIRRGLHSLVRFSFDMNALMTIAMMGAAILGDWPEAAAIAFLYSVSHLLESYSMEKTRHSLRSLMEVAPGEATVRRGAVEKRMAVNEVLPEDVAIIKPGEKIPVDGILVHGATAVNEAAITGESMPVEKEIGDEVYAGTLNISGAMEVRVTRAAHDTALAKIIHLVEDAQTRRAPAQAFVDRFARIYTPAVLLIAVLVATMPPLLFAEPWSAWIYRALTLIVLACPCALVISTPVAIVSAIGNAARQGVLIKGGAYLEEIGRLTALAFDKTGTLTHGHPRISNVEALNGDARRMLALAAAVEAHSSHLLADAIVRHARHEGVNIPPAEQASSLAGRGARAVVDGSEIFIGNRRFLTDMQVPTAALDARIIQLEEEGKTVMLIAGSGRPLGLIAAEDSVREQSHAMVAALHDAGIRHVAMLTGDHEVTARRIAERLGVDEYRAGLLPEAKAAAVTALREQYGAIGMVGDGINDAPALATANIGMAMGVAGSDTALETADVALMADDLTRIPYTVRLSRRTLRIIRENIIIALGLKLLAVALIFPGWLTLWMAVLADMGASVIVTANGLRLVQYERRNKIHVKTAPATTSPASNE